MTNRSVAEVDARPAGAGSTAGAPSRTAPVDGDLTLHGGRRPESGAPAPVEQPLYGDQRLRIARYAGRSGHVLRLSGQIDAGNSAVLARVLNGHGACDAGTVIDVGQVSFIDVSGLRALLTCACPASHRVRLGDVPPHVQRLLTLLGWDGLCDRMTWPEDLLAEWAA
ncbi:STAS domain-containing protein [Planomonospora sp. ID91781]|uniref:STAS domain-containing protein n=1 Tax=Planomonospora sp. ID91781 TaxID=2738135 RepID=UPI0018C39CD2|nr:STAS domain-containing protein [Planomonospora sp. ID91781]MBG0822955.1 STAS domain-containing protein [Planomonospora sp. ID91781]